MLPLYLLVCVLKNGCDDYILHIFLFLKLICFTIVKADSFAAILYTNALSQFFLSFMVPVCVELGVESKS